MGEMRTRLKPQLASECLDLIEHSKLRKLVAFRRQCVHLAADAQLRCNREARVRVHIIEEREHLGRTYAEIERLNRLVRDMESSRAWRAHLWWQRRRGR